MPRKKSYKKKYVCTSKRIETFDGETLNAISHHINSLIDEYGEEATLYIDEYDNYIDYKRLETDKEFNQRIRREEKAKEKMIQERKKKEERDKKEYERLKKKFGGK